jgi:hypothetical protein
MRNGARSVVSALLHGAPFRGAASSRTAWDVTHSPSCKNAVLNVSSKSAKKSSDMDASKSQTPPSA